MPAVLSGPCPRKNRCVSSHNIETFEYCDQCPNKGDKCNLRHSKIYKLFLTDVVWRHENVDDKDDIKKDLVGTLEDEAKRFKEDADDSPSSKIRSRT